LKVPNAKDITVEMLLNHTAGIPEYVYHKEVWEQLKQNPDKVWSVDERLSYVFGSKPTNAPGKGWEYADSHYLVLGLIIEKVTGKNYYEVLDELIIKPCNLFNTSPSDKREIKGLVVAGYTNLTNEFLLPKKMLSNGKYAFNPQMEWTGGGLVTNVSDLTKWAQQLYGGDVLKPETLKLMLTPAPFKTGLFENAGYGLGCFVGETDSVTYYGHTGFVPGYITYIQYIPKYGIAIALQFNNDASHENFSMKSYFNSIKKAIIEDYKKKQQQ
jgi:D-alanyl-D-alanine carboxypeptidase